MIRLETPRLVIRDYMPCDEEEYYQLKSDEGAMLRYQWDIMVHGRKESGRQLGSVGYTVGERTPVGKLVHAGYFYFPEFWGQGYGTEAFGEVLRFAFEEDGVYRVTTGCLQENRGSERIMQKCGLIKEAEHVDWQWHQDRMKTRLEYRLLKQEYRQLKG